LAAEPGSLLVRAVVLAPQAIGLDLGQNGRVQRIFLFMAGLIAIARLVGNAVPLFLGVFGLTGGRVAIVLTLLHGVRTRVGAKSGAQN
jgi:hypothetical protein